MQRPGRADNAGSPAPRRGGHHIGTPTAGRSVSAPSIGPRPRNGIDAPTRLRLLVRRELLIADLRQARRAHSATSSLIAELRRVTTLAIST